MSKKVLSCIPFFEKRCKKSMELLRKNGFEVIQYQGDKVMTAEEIKAVSSDICGAIVGCETWNEDIFKASPNLKVLARFGIGVECIDLEAAKNHGVKVCNARGMNCDSVGEATIMFALASLRNLVGLTNSTREGMWERYTGNTLKGKTYGLLGFGAIAQYVAKLLQSFDVGRIIAYDVIKNEEVAKKYNVEFVDFETLVKEADILSLHIPNLPETVNMIDEEELRAMKESAVLINVARGPIVNQEALYKALKEHWIAGAAVDVFTEEPVPKENPLLSLKNLICMPHQAADTYETFESISCFDAELIIDVMNGKTPKKWLNQ